MNDRLVWIDCEMTGLNLQLDALVEESRGGVHLADVVVHLLHRLDGRLDEDVDAYPEDLQVVVRDDDPSPP